MAATAWDMVTEKKGSKSPLESHKPPRVSRQNTRDSESPLLPGTAPGARFGGFGFGRQGEKAAADRGWKINRPVDALPRKYKYHVYSSQASQQ